MHVFSSKLKKRDHVGLLLEQVSLARTEGLSLARRYLRSSIF